MKSQSTSLFNEMSKAQLIILTAEVRETLAMDINYPAVKIFTAAEVWNIQRQKRNRVQRRFSL